MKTKPTQNKTYKPGDLPIPHMWIDKIRSDGRVKSFMNTKYQLLCDVINQPEATTNFLRAPWFQNMINAFDDYNQSNHANPITFIHVYLAAYGTQGSPKLFPDKLQNTLTVIFSPADKDGKEIAYDSKNKHCIISPLIGFTSISDDLFKDWTSLYQSSQLTALADTIDKDDPDNYDSDNNFSDTKRINYQYDYIKELSEEINYQTDVHGYTIGGLRIFFAAYTDMGNEQQFGRYPNRLIILFGLTKTNGKKNVDFNIEDDVKDFTLRRQKNLSNYLKTKNVEFIFTGGGGFDNGQLCPTYCQ